MIGLGLSESQAADDREREAAEAAGSDYTGKPCIQCKRIRVYLRRDGRYICEKCETFNPPPSSKGTGAR